MNKFLIAAVALSLASAAGAVTTVSSTNGPDAGPLPGQTVIDNFSTNAGLSGSYQLVTAHPRTSMLHLSAI